MTRPKNPDYVPRTTNPLLSPRKDAELSRYSSVQLTKAQRDTIERKKKRRAEIEQKTRRLFCSCILTEEGHELLKQYAMNINATKTMAMERAIRHCLGCFQTTDGETEGQNDVVEDLHIDGV